MNYEVINFINSLITIIFSILFLLLPYFVSFFTVKSVSKMNGSYGKLSVSKTNIFFKFGFVIWFSIITYFVAEAVIIEPKMRYTTYVISIITVVIIVSNLILDLKSLKK